MKSEYIQHMQQIGIEPNFWISDEYFRKAGFDEHRVGDLRTSRIEIRDGDRVVLPQLSTRTNPKFVFREDVWADFIEFEDPTRRKRFLDYNYIYDPREFFDMKGNKWRVFRKNSKKFPRRYEHLSDLIYYNDFNPDDFRTETSFFMRKWADDIIWTDVEDGETLVEYLFTGEHRGILYDQRLKRILGMNIHDENWMYINFRYCLCLNYPFLSEYMRLLFFVGVTGNKYVNDGGVLGRETLKSFKDKLNPIKINKIYSWKLKD